VQEKQEQQEQEIGRSGSSLHELNSIRWKRLKLIGGGGGEGEGAAGLEFEGILMLPPTSASSPTSRHRLLVVPHGGPHGCTATAFVPSYAFLCAHLQCAILHCNYRGSTGFGQASVDSLPGNIGTNDVEVIHLACCCCCCCCCPTPATCPSRPNSLCNHPCVEVFLILFARPHLPL
jgi:hypothetical protein